MPSTTENSEFVSFKWSRNRCWIKVSHFIDQTTMQFPVTVLFLPIVISDWYWIVFIPITIILDICIYAMMFLHQHYVSYKKFKESMTKCLNGNLAFIDTPLIENFKKVISIAYAQHRMVNFLKPNIKVVQSDKIRSKFTTIPDLTGTTIIVVKKKFNENEIRDIALLAHEFGHAMHTLLRYERYIIPIAVFIYQIILLLYALIYGNWLPFFLLLPINCFLIWQNIIEFDSHIEMNADILALQYIETLWNSNVMHDAALCLIKLRIDSSSKMERSLAQFTVNNCIFNLVPFIYPCDRDSLIEYSHDRSQTIQNDENFSHHAKVTKLSNEFLIRKYLQNNLIRDTSLNLKMDTRSGFSIILYMISLVAATYILLMILTNIHFNLTWSPILIAFILAAIMIIMYTIIFNIIWNKKMKLQSQIGL